LFSGLSTEPAAFSAWTETLELMAWVKKLSVVGYSGAGGNVARFSVKIEIYGP